MTYDESEFLTLSGLQHFTFCKRRWSLIFIEQAWQENVLTIEGSIMHEKAHTAATEKRKDIIITRAMPVFSNALGVRGVCDVVEFLKDNNGVSLQGYSGKYRPQPVEYKHGREHETNADLFQLCGQAMCLEEMLVCDIPKAYIFYGEKKRRLEVALTSELRQEVKNNLSDMHEIFKRGHTPKATPTKSCKSCSLNDICLPKLAKTRSAASYVNAKIKEVDN